MICKERRIGLPWFSTKTQIMTLFYVASRAARTQLTYSIELTTEHVFETFGKESPCWFPPGCGISKQDLSVSLRTVVLKLSWALAPFKRLSTLVKISSFGLCSWLLLGLCTWHPENSYVAPKGDEGPVWETLT